MVARGRVRTSCMYCGEVVGSELSPGCSELRPVTYGFIRRAGFGV